MAISDTDAHAGHHWNEVTVVSSSHHEYYCHNCDVSWRGSRITMLDFKEEIEEKISKSMGIPRTML